MTAIQEVLLISLGLSLLFALFYRFLTKPAEMKRLKEEQKFHKEKMKQAKGNAEETNKLLGEMMKLNQKMMRSSFKPMLASLAVFFLATHFLRTTYPAFAIQLPFTLPLLSYSWPFLVLRDSICWFWWYILITIPATLLFRKLLGVE